jgi:hypothetical protein
VCLTCFALILQVEGALHIFWAIEGLDDDLSVDSLDDATEYQWDSNKHEAKHKEEYMQVFHAQVCSMVYLCNVHRMAA